CSLKLTAMPPKADKQQRSRDVRFVPKPDSSCGVGARHLHHESACDFVPGFCDSYAVDFATPPYAGRLVDAACWSDGAKFSLPLDSDAPGPCAGGCGADAGRARMAEQLSTCARRIRSRRAEPDAGSAELRPRSARARARVLPAPCAIARYDERPAS